MLFRFVERKYWYFLLSGLLIVPGIFFLAIGGLKLGIEFKGGTLLDARFTEAPAATEVHDFMAERGHAEGGRLQIRTLTLTTEETVATQKALEDRYGSRFIDMQPSSVSPSFSAELVTNAVRSIAAASVLIVLLIAFAV